MAARAKFAPRSPNPDVPLWVDVDVHGCNTKGSCRTVRAKGKVDTGAQNSYVPKRIAQALGLPKIADARVLGVTGARNTAVLGGVTLTFPGRALRPVPLTKRGVMVYPTDADHVLLSRRAMAGGDDKSAAMALEYDAGSGRFELKPARRRAKDQDEALLRRSDEGDNEDAAEATRGRLFARSFERYNGGVKIKRLYGSSTVTRFYVGEEGSDPSTWVPIDGYGPTQGERASFAKRVYWSTSAHSGAAQPKTAARAEMARVMRDYPLPEDPREIAVGLISAAKVRDLEARGLRVQVGSSDPDARDVAEGVLGRRLATLEAVGLGVVEDESTMPHMTHTTRETHATHSSHAAERGYASLEPLALTTIAFAGAVAAPKLNTAIKARPLGAHVPPSAGASVLLLVGGGLAHRGGYRKTGNASIALGIGMGVGTLLASKAEGGMLAARA